MLRKVIYGAVALLGIGSLSACGGMDMDRDSFVTAETPISSEFPVQGLDDEHN